MKADLVIRNGTVVTPESTFDGGVAIHDEKFVAIGANDALPKGVEEIDARGKHILPGLIDGHVHFREPGMTHKEDFGTGSRAAVAGGVTFVVDMPNTIPPVTHPEQVEEKKRLAEEKSMVDFALLGVVVQTNADQILPMARAGAVGYKIFFGETIGNLPFPDDGVCQDVFRNITESRLPLCIHAENRQIMYHHLNRIKEEGKTAPVHWESTRPYLCEAESVHHALFFAEVFGTRLHVLHMSSKQAAALVRDARARGLRVTAETGPHYLLREPGDMETVGPLLKMNPPVRTRDHGEALWDGLLQGYVDMIATDHSPHTLEEKGADIHGNMRKPAIWDCISGFCGVETGVPLMLTEVNKGRMSLNHYVRVASENPAKVWQLYPRKGALRVGADGDVTVVDMDREGAIDITKLHSKNNPSPWHGWKVKGMPVAAVVRGHVQMRDGEPVGRPIGRMVTPTPE